VDEFIICLILRELHPLALRCVFSDYHERIFRVDSRRLVLQPTIDVLDSICLLFRFIVQSELLGCTHICDCDFVLLDLTDLLHLPLDVIFSDVLDLVYLLQEALDACVLLTLFLQLFWLLGGRYVHWPFVDLNGVLDNWLVWAFDAQVVTVCFISPRFAGLGFEIRVLLVLLDILAAHASVACALRFRNVFGVGVVFVLVRVELHRQLFVQILRHTHKPSAAEMIPVTLVSIIDRNRLWPITQIKLTLGLRLTILNCLDAVASSHDCYHGSEHEACLCENAASLVLTLSIGEQ